MNTVNASNNLSSWGNVKSVKSNGGYNFFRFHTQYDAKQFGKHVAKYARSSTNYQNIRVKARLDDDLSYVAELVFNIPGWGPEKGEIALSEGSMAVGIAVKANNISNSSIVVLEFKEYQSVCDLKYGWKLINFRDGSALWELPESKRYVAKLYYVENDNLDSFLRSDPVPLVISPKEGFHPVLVYDTKLISICRGKLICWHGGYRLLPTVHAVTPAN